MSVTKEDLGKLNSDQLVKLMVDLSITPPLDGHGKLTMDKAGMIDKITKFVSGECTSCGQQAGYTVSVKSSRQENPVVMGGRVAPCKTCGQ